MNEKRKAVSMMERLRAWARRMKMEARALSFAAGDPRTPWYAKLLAAAVAAYAMSPLDLIPDFIPVLGYLDDLLLVPAGILLAAGLVPREVMEDCRRRAEEAAGVRSRTAAVAIVLIWICLAVLAGLLIARAIGRLHPVK